MPKVKISDFSTTANNNTDINSINIAEGCAPSGINDAIRTLMAQLKDWQSGAVAQDNSFNGAVTVSGAAVMSSTLAVTGAQTNSSNLTLNGQSDLRFADSDSSNWVAFQAPATIASNVTWTLPAADGTANQVLKTDGAGLLGWVSAASGDVTTTGTQTLTNKTLTSPVLTTPSSTGGTFTTPRLVSVRETATSFSPAAGDTVTPDLSTANVFTITLPTTGAVTIAAPTNPPASGTYFAFVLRFATTGAATVTFNAVFKFPGGVAPTLTAVTGKVDTLVAYTVDGGTTYQTFTSGLNA